MPKILPIFAAVLLVVAGCSDSTAPDPTPTASSIEVVNAPPSTWLAEEVTPTITIRAVDEDGLPVAGVEVEWNPLVGEMVSPIERQTGAQGEASAHWKLGPGLGDQRLEVRVDDGFRDFLIQAAPDEPVEATLLSASLKEMAAGEPPSTVHIQALNVTGEPTAAEVDVAVELHAPDGSLIETSSINLVDGEVLYTPASPLTQAGAYMGQAAINGTDLSVTWTYEVAPGPAASLEMAEPFDVSTGIAGEPLPSLPRLRATDEFDNPLGGEAVEGALLSGGGSLFPEVFTLDEDGTGGPDEWILGEDYGDNTARFSIGDVTLDVSVEGRPPQIPDDLSFDSPLPDEAFVGDTIESIVVVLLDDEGAPISDQKISWTVDSGAIAETMSLTDGSGRAAVDSWVLGSESGAQSITATLDEWDLSTTHELIALDIPEATTVQVTSGQDQTGEPDETLSTPIVIQVLDQYDNGIQSNLVWTADHGSVPQVHTETDPDGTSAQTWTLGSDLGEQTLNVALENDPSIAVEVVATASLGPVPSSLDIHSGNNQSGTIEEALSDPIRVIARDQDNSPIDVNISWEVLAGGGSLSSASNSTGSNGIASNSWVLGDLQGEQTVRATITDSPDLHVTFTATGSTPPVGSYYEILGGYLVQATQVLDHSTPLVAGRDAHFRGFLNSTDGSGSGPQIEVELLEGGAVYRTLTINQPPSGIPSDGLAAEGNWGQSYNMTVAGSDVRTGMQIRIRSEHETIWPTGGAMNLDVADVPDLDLTLVRIHTEETNRTGYVTSSNAEDYIQLARKLLPFPDYNIHLYGTYDYDGDRLESDGTGWSALLSELNQVRVANGGPGIWYGVVQTDYGSGVAGVGYVGGKTSIGFDASSQRDWVLTHELGHNLGRLHAPCGTTASLEPNYPHSDGSTGAWGLDYASSSLYTPDAPDFMGYCSGSWVGPYHFTAMTNHATANFAQVGMMGTEPVLRIWGELRGDEVYLEPSFIAHSRTDGQGGGLRVTAQALDADGRVLGEQAGQAWPLSHATAQHFSIDLDISEIDVDEIALLRVTEVSTGRSGTRVATELSMTPPVDLEWSGDTVTMKWDADLAPMLVLRDAESDAVIGFARGGRHVLSDPGSQFTIEASNGARSLDSRHIVR